MISFPLVHWLLGLTFATHYSPSAGRDTPSLSCDSSALALLPLIERPATTDTGSVLVLLMTGDGGWASADEGVARALLARGAAVVGLNMRSCLSRTRSPDELARDVTCIAESYVARWHRITGGYDAMAEWLVQGLRPPTRRAPPDSGLAARP